MTNRATSTTMSFVPREWCSTAALSCAPRRVSRFFFSGKPTVGVVKLGFCGRVVLCVFVHPTESKQSAKLMISLLTCSFERGKLIEQLTFVGERGRRCSLLRPSTYRFSTRCSLLIVRCWLLVFCKQFFPACH